MCVLNDITSEINQCKWLEEISQYKDLLLATVTHDLKAPLVSVIYYTKLLQNEISDKKEGNINEYLDIIECNSILLQNLVMDIQDLSQIK